MSPLSLGDLTAESPTGVDYINNISPTPYVVNTTQSQNNYPTPQNLNDDIEAERGGKTKKNKSKKNKSKKNKSKKNKSKKNKSKKNKSKKNKSKKNKSKKNKSKKHRGGMGFTESANTMTTERETYIA
jgi:hypothetical protein